MATEFTPLRELRCGRCGTRYEIRLYKRAGLPDNPLNIDALCPVCPLNERASQTDAPKA